MGKAKEKAKHYCCLDVPLY